MLITQIGSIVKTKLLFTFVIFLFLFLTTKFEIFEKTYTFVFYFILIINSVFFLEIKEFLSHARNKKESLVELFSVAFTGLSNIGLFAYVYYKAGVESPSGIIIGEFITSLYFSIVTWTTLGYGDLKPTDDLRLLASLEALMGYVYMAVLIGLFLNLLQTEKSE